MLIPRQKTPNLTLPTVAHGQFELGNDQAQRGTLLCFYRGLHCPICIRYLTELEKLTAEFAERGVKTIAISSDSEDRAKGMAEKIGASALRIAYDLPLAEARDWGLYVSTSRGKTSTGVEEPALFSEPGLFLVTPERTLYFASVQTMPFVRPNFRELLGSLDFVIEKSYPARGEYSGAV